MGNNTYNVEAREVRCSAEGYATKSMDEVFTQQRARKVHESMDSRKIALRECRDSEAHPKALPIILGLDVTGSMRSIPRHLIAEGLPTLMSTIIQRGIPDASLLFLAIGDHECDSYPLQVGQFESGDAELDMWLTRSYLEGGGGGNAGESYPLAWDFAANHTQTDAWDKRKEKGFIITIGDEPFLDSFPKRAMNELYLEGGYQSTLTAEQLYKAASERYNIFHISVEHDHRTAHSMWDKLLGQRHIKVSDYTQVPDMIAELVINNYGNSHTIITEQEKQAEPALKEDKIQPML